MANSTDHAGSASFELDGRAAAFFDLDGTLLTTNSGRLWLRRERREGRISRLQVCEAILYLALYRINAININFVTRRALKTVRGVPEADVRAWTRRWFHQEVVLHVAPGGIAAIVAHRGLGHRLVLLTSSSPYEAEEAESHFGLDDALSTRYEVADTCFTGDVRLPVCYGPGKVVMAERYAERHGIDLAASYFYTDSISDLPMLERVGHPRVVNPDLRLRLVAGKRNWPILDWHRRTGERSRLPATDLRLG